METAFMSQPTPLILSTQPALELSDSDLKKLVTAIVDRAVRDAAGVSLGSPSNEDIRARARFWLVSRQGAVYLEMLGIQPEKALDWVKAGCPDGRFSCHKHNYHTQKSDESEEEWRQQLTF